MIIKENPALLSIRSSVVDPSSERTIVGTAFQAAIGAGDEPMWNMMLPYFKSLEQGEASRQFDEQFPNGVEDEISAEQLKDHYNTLALAIITSKDNGTSAIEQFRKDITSQKEVKQGRHFNLQHFITVRRAFEDNRHALVNSHNDNLFWQKIIGYVQRQMTAYDAQILCSGLFRVLQDKCNFKRTFDIYMGFQGKFFPLTAEEGLGFDFAYYSFEEESWDIGKNPVGLRESPRPASNLKNFNIHIETLYKNKTNGLARLEKSLEQGRCYQPN